MGPKASVPMRRVTPPRCASWCSPFVAVAALVGSVCGQHDRALQLAERAIAELGDPAQVADATRRLENLGAAAVRPLCEALRSGPRDGLPSETRQLILYVLGRLGRAALPALPSLRDAVRDGDPDVGRQAAWALSMLAPFLNEEQCRVLLVDLQDMGRDVRISWHAQILLASLALGPHPTQHQLLPWIEQGGVRGIAAYRWLAARADDLGDSQPDVLAAVTRELERVTRRPLIRSAAGGSSDGPEVALAWLALAKAPLAAAPARALLDHWCADDRRRGVAWLHEHGAALPLRERADLVGRLWDSDPTIAAATARAFAAWGKAGVVALPALHLMQRNHADAAVAADCGDAAAAVLLACTDVPAADREWLAAVDAALRGERAATPAAGCSPAGRELLGEVLLLAQWNDATSLARVLELVEDAGPASATALQAVLGWLPHHEARAVDLACAWLARRGAEARVLFGAGGGTGEPFEEFLRWTCQYRIHDGARRAGIEMLAHLLAAGATAPELALLLDDANSRVVAHGLAKALAAPRGSLQRHTARLQALLFPPASTTMRIVGSAWDARTLPVDLGNHVRTLAAIALVDLGVELPPTEGLDDVVRQTIGVPLADLARHVADLRETSRLPALLDRIEDQCRLLMSVPPHLRWPSLATTPR